ncbi:MAG: general secretion pathway protein GspD [Colwellia sp.]|nr:general secretion pathway protein GspD [Colwellia sp.]
MKPMKQFMLSLISLLLISACANQPNQAVKLDDSYLKGNTVTKVDNAKLISENNNETLTAEEQQKFRFVPALKLHTTQAVTAEDILSQFNEKPSLTITADGLPLADYLHQILGEQLQLNYILSEEVEADKKTVTLNLQDKISPRKVFTLTEEILSQRGYVIRFDDNIFYVHKDSGRVGKGDVVYGYGKQLSDVPQSSLEIVQMMQFEYGVQVSLAFTLRQLTGVKAVVDQQRNTLTVQGKRKEVVRALELVHIMDKPSLKDRHIGIYKSTFLPTNELVVKLTELLGQEGISVGSGKVSNQALSIVELDKQGELIFFANNTLVIERAVFWVKKLDQPILTAEEQYFIYQPMYSRAIDMGESLEALIGDGAGRGLDNSTSAASQNSSSTRDKPRSASGKGMKMVVDERSNSLIFYTSGTAYQQLLPLIKRLDVLPKQVLLEVMIAEVKLTDTFKAGIKFDLTNKGVANIVGGFDLTSGSSGLSYILSGAQGSITASLLQTNSHVNVLSKPTLLVRDGVQASITVGDDIPTVGEIVSDPINGSRTSVVYRKTGVDLKVKPTINARGVVIMEISQKISNQAPGDDSVAGSPIIFERTITTEVIAESGQTIVLGGLISDNRTRGNTSVPFFSSLPLIGEFFNTKSDSKDKTELVVLVTPRIIESNDEWQEIKAKLSASFTQLELE